MRRLFKKKLTEAAARMCSASPRRPKFKQIDPTLSITTFQKTVKDMPKCQLARTTTAFRSHGQTPNRQHCTGVELVNDSQSSCRFFTVVHSGFIVHSVNNTSSLVNNSFVIISVSISSWNPRVNNNCEYFLGNYSPSPNSEVASCRCMYVGCYTLSVHLCGSVLPSHEIKARTVYMLHHIKGSIKPLM